jgi:hypothetical protein
MTLKWANNAISEYIPKAYNAGIGTINSMGDTTIIINIKNIAVFNKLLT